VTLSARAGGEPAGRHEVDRRNEGDTAEIAVNERVWKGTITNGS
jgi:hypothetical protein